MKTLLKQRTGFVPMGLTWIVNLGYNLFVRMAHHIAPKIKPMGLNWAVSSSYSGGCLTRSSEWSNPPQGPTIRFFNKLNVIKTHRCRHERNTRN